jgi:hypothetical protein
MTISLNGSTGIVTPEVEGRVIDENGFQVFGGDPENRIINGAFDFWQRGTSFTASAYGADRWLNNNQGGTVTQSRQTHNLGVKLGSNNAGFYLRQTVSGQSAVNHFAVTRQFIESVRSYAGETITVLGWARRSSGSGNMVVEGGQSFGTGGSPSANVSAISPTTINLTADWEPFAAVLVVPAVEGKTTGTDGNSLLQINIWTSAGSDFNARTNSLGIQTIGVDLWGIHIKRGTHTAAATDFYKAPELGPELLRCQRYYQTGRLFMQGLTQAGTNLGASTALAVVMRATPTGSLTTFSSAALTSGPNIQALTNSSIGMNAVFSAATGANIFADYTADAEL